jgi:hypothetical protein
MDEERLDLSALDPSVEGARWELMMDAVVSRGMASLAMAQRPSVADLLAGWRRPVLALAAVMALVAIPLLLFVQEQPVGKASPQQAAVTLAVIDWAWAGETRPTDLIEAIGR